MRPDPRTRERRPRTDADPTNTTTTILAAVPTASEDATHARCRRCGANLSRPESVAAELGPVCRHAVDLDELEGVRRG